MVERLSNKNNISKNLKNYRKQHHMKQTDMAKELDMHYQNYSQLERNVYTPSLEKILDICNRLNLSPNDLLLDGRDYDDYKKQYLEKLDSDVIDVLDRMQTIEQLRAEAKVARLQGNKEAEKAVLDQIIQIFYWGTLPQMRELADLLYYNDLNNRIKKISEATSENFKSIL